MNQIVFVFSRAYQTHIKPESRVVVEVLLEVLLLPVVGPPVRPVRHVLVGADEVGLFRVRQQAGGVQPK